MKHKKIVFLILILICIALLFTNTALAGTVHVGTSDVPDYFEYHNSSGWHDLNTPNHYIVENNAIAYCIEHKLTSPHNATYSDTDILNNYSARTRTGLQIILENGYPYTTGGLSAAKARYATANAIRFWLSEQGEAQNYNFTNFGSYSNSQLRAYAASGQIGSKVRAKSGQNSVLQYSIELLIMARSQALMPHHVSFSPMNMSISGNYFTGTTRVSLTNMNRGYTLNTSGLPGGSSVSGYTGSNGDLLTVRIPMNAANSNRGFSISAIGYDNRMRANMAAYDAHGSNYQSVVTVITGPSTAASTSYMTAYTPAVPDLTVLALYTNKGSYEAGETIVVTAQIRNQGTGNAGGFNVSLSSNAFPIQTKRISSLGVNATQTVTFYYTAPIYTHSKNIAFTATADSNNWIIELNEANNTRNVNTIINAAQPDLIITNLRSDKASYEAGETVTVTAVAANMGYQAVSSTTMKLEISRIGIQSKPVSSLAAGGGTRTVVFTFTAPTSLTAQTITLKATIDPNNTIREGNESNNYRTATLIVKALRPDVTVIGSTATDWYAGMDVTVSATVRNLTAQTVPSVAICLNIGDLTYTENIPIAGNGSNLTVFRIKVPDAGDYSVTFTADANDSIGEIDEGNNTWSKNITVLNVPPSTVIDPDDTSMEQQYNVYGLRALPSLNDSDYHTWQEVRYEGGNYVTKNYWIRLTTAFNIMPDNRIAYDEPDVMESGFGNQVACTTTLTTNYDHPDKLVGAQMVWVRYPESGFGQTVTWQYVRDSLQPKTGNEGEKTVTWQYQINSYSVTGSRLHYVPLWYPDGEYVAWVQAFYAWSPVGQLYEHKTDTLTILGDMYDRITTIKR